jgi:thioredoxin reductase/NAD-dependent dihydropyrimidine dehydrogenase PreA subunit
VTTSGDRGRSSSSASRSEVVVSDQLLWGVSFAVLAAIVLPYLLGFRRRRAIDRARKQEAILLGTDRPVAQFPFIDATRCIGCGSCVEACPEGDVLGVVGGTATVVNGLRCIGHARCEIACPVGAIEIGLGDLRSRSDVPSLDEWQQTSVPGVYIAGELAGLSLVKNAIEQGRRVVERVAELAPAARRATAGECVDLLVVGAGPAGLSAAAAARQRGLTTLLLEQEQDLGGTILHYPRRKLVLMQEVELPFLGRRREGEYGKQELLEMLQEMARRARLEIRFGQRMTALERHEGRLAVRTGAGTAHARFVLLALGRRGTPRKLGVPGEELPKVVYQLVDAASYRNQQLLVVGGGDSAVEAAIGLARQPGNRVALSYRREKLVRIKKRNEDRITRLLAKRQVDGLFASEIREIRSDLVCLNTPRGSLELPNDQVFVFAGGEPPFELLRRSGIRFGGESAAPPRG